MYIFNGKVCDAYGVLGLVSGATDNEVKKAYLKLATQYHPDKNPGDEVAANKMKVVNTAYEEITKRRKGTFKPSNAQYEADDGSLAKEGKSNSSRNDGGTAQRSTSNEYNTYGNQGNYYNNDTYSGKSYYNNYYDFGQERQTSDDKEDGIKRNKYKEDSLKRDEYYIISDIIKNNQTFYSNLSNKLEQKLLVMTSKREKDKLSKLIDIFKEQEEINCEFYIKFEANLNKSLDTLQAIKEEYDNFNRNATVVKNLYKYFDEEMRVIKSAVSLELSMTHQPNYISKVETCVYMSIYFEDLIKEYINKYIQYSGQEQYEYAYKKIVITFDHYLSMNFFKIKDLSSGIIKGRKFKKFLEVCCKDFEFDENYVYRGNYGRK